MSAAKPPVVNPYARPCRPFTAINDEEMGRQSQQRVANQHKRKFKLCSNSNSQRKIQKGDQLTLEGAVAFDSDRDCAVCKAKNIRKHFPTYPVPHRGHHPLCIHNKNTKGKGLLQSQSVTVAEDKRYRQLTRPIQQGEKFSSNNMKTAAATFFDPREINKQSAAAQQEEVPMAQLKNDETTPSSLCSAVMHKVNTAEFREKHKAKGALLPMIAFAETVVEKIIRSKDNTTMDFFEGMTMTVPACHEANDNPEYHSIVGQKLLYVDWQRLYGLEIPCPHSACTGTLNNTRSNFSKNKTLFPIYGLEGSPSWCIVQSMACSRCRRPFAANDGEVLVRIPAHIADDYPVESTYAVTNAGSHISRNASEIFATIMITYGNGELCSKLLYDAINRNYMGKIKAYYSAAQSRKEASTRPKAYVSKDGDFIRQYPPLGDTIRDLYNQAASSATNRWGISDYERNTREIQGVKCDGIFAQDHTFEPIKNYQKATGAKAAWDAATQTGEIASVVLVPSTKTEDFAHAAQSLLKRPHFNPRVMYSDTWPHKAEYWEQLKLEGRLGLFHYQKRIISTLRKTHIDYFDAITDLLAALYAYHPDDFERLLTSLKDGSLSKKGHKYTSSEITAMRGTRQFRDRYSKYLRKQMHEHQTIIQMLDDWFCKYKVTASNPDKPAYGRLDPIRLQPLFTEETKQAVENCKEKAQYLSDPFPLRDMYQEVLPNPNASHTLSEFLSNRGESKLEAFHDRFAHFANCGMRDTLADNLNLAGTARYNLSIRHVRSLASKYENPQSTDRRKIPAAWEKVIPFFNHSELWYVNNLAKSVGCEHPFPKAETLIPDNGERFFSHYITNTLPSLKSIKHGTLGECLCTSCTKKTTDKTQQQSGSPSIVNNDNQHHHHHHNNNNNNSQIVTVTTTPKTNRKYTNNHQTRQPAQCAIANTINYTHLAPTYSPPICYMPQLVPWQYQLPLYLAPQMQNVCCQNYSEWLKIRKGRPPHHLLCPNR